MPPQRRRGEAHAAGLFFLLAAVTMTWPLASDLAHHVPDTGDPYLTSWILRWDAKQLFRDPARLFDANIFHPAKLTLALSENLFGVAVFGFPLEIAGAPPLTTYNALFLLGMALSGFAMWALAREITKDGAASVVAGLFYAFSPFRFDHLSHIQLQWAGFIPLALLFLHRFLRTRSSRDLTLFALFFAWNGLTSIYLSLFGVLAVAATLGLGLNQIQAWRSPKILARLGKASLAVAAVVTPFYVPYLLAARIYDFHRSLADASLYSALPKAFLSAGFRNKAWGAFTARFAQPEGQLFAGIVILLLASAGIMAFLRNSAPPEKAGTGSAATHWLDATILTLAVLRLILFFTGRISLGRVLRIHEPYRASLILTLLIAARLAIAFPRTSRFRNLADFLRRNRLRPEGTWALALIVLGVVVAAGPRLFVYHELYEFFPFIFGAIRGTARAILIAHIGLATLAAFGVSSLRQRFPRYAVPILVACNALLLWELRAAPLSLVRADADPTQLTRWLAPRHFRGGILELPTKLEDNFEYVYRVTQHDHPILNGYSGFFPPDFLELQNRFASNPVPSGTMDRVRKMDGRLVVFHPNKATTEELGSIGAFLKAQLTAGELKPAAYFRDQRDTSLVFEVTPVLPIATTVEESLATKNIDAFLASPGEAKTPPYGWFDGPVNGAIVHGGEVRGSGWAASDSGMDRIEISVDGRIAGRATYGFPRPDVIAAKPRVPCKALCGYRYRIVNVSSGKHVLATRFVGKNGKDVVLPKAEIWMQR